MSAARDNSAGQRRARRHERALYLASHPIVFGLAALAARLGPVCYIPGIGHVVSDIALAKEVLSAPERFAKTGPGALSDAFSSVIGARALLNMDGEPHRLLRAQLRELFAPRYVSELVARVSTPSLATVRSALAAGESVDVARLTQVLAGRVVCALVGRDPSAGAGDDDYLDVYRRGRDFTAALSLRKRRLAPARLAAARQRFEALTSGARAAYDDGDPSSVPGRLRAAGLSFDDCRGLIGVLLLAGTETTASALPRIVALAIDTGAWPALRADRASIAGAVEEGLRLTAPVAVATRNVVDTTTLNGRRLRKNERVIVCFANLLRSPDAAADRGFDVHRRQAQPVANLWFGHGPHFCLGAALARREIETALEALLDGGDLRIVRRRYARRAVFAGYSELTVARV